MDFRYFIIDT